MASKGRHLADLLSDDARGVDVGNANAKIKEEKARLKKLLVTKLVLEMMMTIKISYQ